MDGGIVRGMKALAPLAVAAALLALAPAAGAKIKLSLDVLASAQTGRPVTVVLGSAVPLDFDLKLIAVAPGKSWYDVVGKITGDASRPQATIPQDGFGVRVVRTAPNRWRAVVRFPRAGTWRLLIPNEAPEGFMIPPPLVRRVVVR
jgi:hypothetical protein